MAVELVRYRFTADEYEQMIESGILAEDDRLELVEGEIIAMSPIGSEHAACVKRLNYLLQQALGARVIVGVQDPIRLDAHSQPQPDLTRVGVSP
jgi:Uma2 family endonuclease